MNGQMQRREFITLVGSAAAWPLAARAEQQERMRRIFVLMGTANDAEAQTRAEALRQALQVLGWTMGRNIQIDYSFGSGDVERMRVYAKEAVASGPDLILAQTNPALQAVRNATPSQPIIFLQVSDPVSGGFVESLAHPGGNITGFTNFESEIGGKWLQTLKEIAPAVERVAVVLHPETSAHGGCADQYRTAASYVDRVLRGANPADLPVQVPTKYQTVVNLKTAKALGLTVPPGLLVAADEVIE
jgi:putative ABC transport system substrate-binding protein